MVKDIITAKHFINVRGELLDLSKPRIMGILNITPDSFYEGSRMMSEDTWLSRAGQMVSQGVDILDVGGYSSRPGADHIEASEELDRVAGVVTRLRAEFDVCISIDTFRSSVARGAVECGADIINDISGGRLDPEMFEAVSDLQVPYIMMHMRGTPQNMRELTEYNHLLNEMVDYFNDKVRRLVKNGVSDIIVDPGFGFAKTVDQNYEILRNLEYFKVLERPILVGVSRKSMIFRTLNTEPANSLNGTTVLHTIALQKGACILRVHDVREASEVIKLVDRTFKD